MNFSIDVSCCLRCSKGLNASEKGIVERLEFLSASLNGGTSSFYII